MGAALSFLEANEAARARALEREAVVKDYTALLADCGGKMACLEAVAGLHEVSASQLRRWVTAYEAQGLNGLVDQKQGRVGRKAVAAAMGDDLVARGKALTCERGSVSRAARELMRDPTLPAGLRLHLHEGHASKSYVTPSVRAAIEPCELTKVRAQGPKAARLAGRWTPGDYSAVTAGLVFTADDMTSNVYCWCEWPNAQGWRVGPPQILPVMDVGSLRWLTARVIMRAGGQYCSDDIWGLFGDCFDAFGLPHVGFLLEGGHWQSTGVQGTRTGLTDDERIGGLASLGLKSFRSWDPRSKGMLEGAFNVFQAVCDSYPGFMGREQRYDLPELMKKRLALCEAGKRHPSEYFPHVAKYADHVRSSFEQLNHERQEGQILRGRSPLEKWAEDAPVLRSMPPEAQWMYRSAMSLCTVTRNGVRITQGSGAKMQVYYYDQPEILTPRQGAKILVYWNDHNPDLPAALVDARTRKFLGLAPRVQPLSRFTATDAQLESEAQRKRAAMLFARSELRAMQPHLARRAPLPVDPAAMETGQAMAEAKAAAEARAATAKAMAKEVRRHGEEYAEELLSLERTAEPADTTPEGDLLDDLHEPRPRAVEPAALAEDLLEDF